MYVGIIVGAYSAGGLSGVWMLLLTFREPHLAVHLAAAVLFGLMGSMIVFGCSAREDRLWIGSLIVFAVSLAAAALARLYGRPVTTASLHRAL